MKFNCVCGNRINDTTDYLPYKAYFIPDQDWFAMLNVLRDAIDSAGQSGTPTSEEVEKRLWEFSQIAWQCEECARVYLEAPGKHLYRFSYEGSSSEDGAEVKNVFSGRQDVRG